MFDEHVGDTNSWHNQAWRKSLDLLNQRQCIQTVFEKQTVRQKMDYRVQLNAFVDCARFLAKQGLAFCGHDESESSSNKGNFLEILRFLGDHNEFINKVVLDKAPQNLRLTSPDTQNDIVNAAAKETTKEIIAELGDDLFAVLVDESRDVSFKEQMTVVIRFVNNRGLVVERFLGIIHVSEITSLSLKVSLEDLLGKNGLSLSRLRDQGYDRASNMRGEFNGLKTLIMKENSTAYFLHCFAYQLQLCLVAVAKSHSKVTLLFQMIFSILNVAYASCKRRDRLREKRRIEMVEAISHYEALSERGDTRWSSHFKTLNRIIILFSATVEVIEEIERDGAFPEQ